MASPADPNDYSAKDISFLASELARRNAQSYSRTAAGMHRCHNNETAQLFEFLAEAERTHESAALKKLEKGSGPGNGASAPLLPKEMELEKEPHYPFYLSTYDGVCCALEHTKNAFDFFAYLSSRIRDQNVREAADFFAKEAVSQTVTLRLERMKANRRLREFRQDLGWWCDPAGIETIEDMERGFAAMESALAPIYGGAMQIFKTAENMDAANCLKRYAGEAFCYHIFHDIDVEKLPGKNPDTQEDQIDILLGVLKATNQAFEFAFQIAEKSTDDEVLVAATSMAEKLSKRLKTINQILEGLVKAS